MKAGFAVISGPLSGLAFEIPPGEFVIGREKDCQLAVDSPFVARHHCMLLWDGVRLIVRDLRSQSGTWVNLEPIRRNDCILGNGDTVRAGKLVIRITLGNDDT
jgi:pSer/pThr/pTyr-binding forkhead associated (FHA) protein